MSIPGVGGPGSDIPGGGSLGMMGGGSIGRGMMGGGSIGRGIMGRAGRGANKCDADSVASPRNQESIAIVQCRFLPGE